MFGESRGNCDGKCGSGLEIGVKSDFFLQGMLVPGGEWGWKPDLGIQEYSISWNVLNSRSPLGQEQEKGRRSLSQPPACPGAETSAAVPFRIGVCSNPAGAQGIESGWQLPAPGAGSPLLHPPVPCVPSCPLCPRCQRSPPSLSPRLPPPASRSSISSSSSFVFSSQPSGEPSLEFPCAPHFVTAVTAGRGGTATRPAGLRGAGDSAVPAALVAPTASPSFVLRSRLSRVLCSGSGSLSQHPAGEMSPGQRALSVPCARWWHRRWL